MKKIIMSFASMSLLAAALASCASPNNSTGDVNTGTGPVEIVDETAEISKAYANLKAGKAVTFEFWHSFGDAISSQLVPLVTEFKSNMKSQGFNIDVKVTNKGGGYDGLRQAVNLGVESNTIPTLVLGYPDHFADYIKQGLISPLDAFVYNDNAEIALDGVTADSNDFVKSYWDENQLYIGDSKSVAGIPFNKSTEIMCYNSNVVDPILKELEYIDEGDTWQNPTWEEVYNVGKYIKENATKINYTYEGGAYTVDKDMAYPVYIDSEANFFITTSRQWGGEGNYTIADGMKGTLVAWNEYTKAAMDYFLPKALTTKVIQLPAAGGTGSYGSSYMAVRKAFISVGSTAGVKNNASSSYYMKATTYPQYEGSDNKAVIQQGTNLTIVSKNSTMEQRVAAWLLTKYLTSTDVQVKFSTKTGYLPVRNSARDSEAFKDLLASADPQHPYHVFNGDVAKGIIAALAQQDYYYTDPAFNGSSVVRDLAATAMNDMFRFGKTYTEAMTAFYKKTRESSIAVEKRL